MLGDWKNDFFGEKRISLKPVFSKRDAKHLGVFQYFLDGGFSEIDIS